MKRDLAFWAIGSFAARLLALVGAVIGFILPASAQPQSPLAVQTTPYLTRQDAVLQALQNNPLLKTVRHQHGFGDAAVLLARTYPFNPVFTTIVAHNSGPESAGITNSTFNEDYVVLELELRGQGRYRRDGAAAMVTRIEWEIVQQEIAVSVAVIRAYNTALYREKKLEAVEETIKLNAQALESVRRLVEAGKLRAADQLLAASALEDVRAQRGQSKTALAIARSDLRRVLGTLDDAFGLAGGLDVQLPNNDQNALTQLALAKRPDLQARYAAIQEAESALKLIEANRFGNPVAGPQFAIDATQVVQVGARVTFPLPVFNLKRGEILKARTEVAKVRSEARGLELQTAQDVQAALSRFFDAKAWAEAYEKEVVPNLRKTKQEMEKLFINNDPAADISRVLAVQRAYLKAAESLLDARYEMSQAEADLALAVAEPALALGITGSPAPTPGSVTVQSEPLPATASAAPPRPAFTPLPARALLGQPVVSTAVSRD